MLTTPFALLSIQQIENVIYYELRMRGYSVDVGVIPIAERDQDGKVVRKQLEVALVCNLGSSRYWKNKYLTINVRNYSFADDMKEKAMAVLELAEVSYYYFSDKPVLKGINISFEKGKFYAICGPSGCGKTTLLSLIGGLDEPKSGEILYEGESIMGKGKGLAWHRRNNVAFVFQNYNLIEYMTPKENVLLTAKEDPIPILESLGITKEEAGRNVLKLSGGQQQRVAIARALASHAPVILADEPTGNLDEDTAAEITQILKDNAHKQGRCVIVVTHSDAVAEEADVVLRLDHGKIAESLKSGMQILEGNIEEPEIIEP